MHTTPDLAVEIARQVIPDEIFQAQLIAENFAKGGKSRRELLRHARAGELGGFGAGEAALLPWIFHAMAVAAPFLTGFIASRTLDNASTIVRAIHSALNARKSVSRNQGQSSLQQHADNTPASPQLQAVPQQIQQCVGEMAKALQKAGLPQEGSEEIAYKVMLVLWENATDALVFLHRITEKK